MNAILNSPPVIQRPVRWGRWVTAGLAAAAGAAVLFHFNPVEHSFFPPCLFHEWTGLSCPACGSTRALHQLLHGHLFNAFCFNPLLVLSLPVIAYAALRWLVWATAGVRWPFIRWRPAWGWLLAGAIIGFAVLRNLPIPALAWMHL